MGKKLKNHEVDALEVKVNDARNIIDEVCRSVCDVNDGAEIWSELRDASIKLGEIARKFYELRPTFGSEEDIVMSLEKFTSKDAMRDCQRIPIVMDGCVVASDGNVAFCKDCKGCTSKRSIYKDFGKTILGIMRSDADRVLPMSVNGLYEFARECYYEKRGRLRRAGYTPNRADELVVRHSLVFIEHVGLFSAKHLMDVANTFMEYGERDGAINFCTSGFDDGILNLNHADMKAAVINMYGKVDDECVCLVKDMKNGYEIPMEVVGKYLDKKRV